MVQANHSKEQDLLSAKAIKKKSKKKRKINQENGETEESVRKKQKLDNTSSLHDQKCVPQKKTSKEKKIKKIKDKKKKVNKIKEKNETVQKIKEKNEKVKKIKKNVKVKKQKAKELEKTSQNVTADTPSEVLYNGDDKKIHSEDIAPSETSPDSTPCLKPDPDTTKDSTKEDSSANEVQEYRPQKKKGKEKKVKKIKDKKEKVKKIKEKEMVKKIKEKDGVNKIEEKNEKIKKIKKINKVKKIKEKNEKVKKTKKNVNVKKKKKKAKELKKTSPNVIADTPSEVHDNKDDEIINSEDVAPLETSLISGPCLKTGSYTTKYLAKHSSADKKVKKVKDSTAVPPLTGFLAGREYLRAGSGFVWDVPDTTQDSARDSSDSEEEKEESKKKKAKKLSKAERELLAKEEEKRLHDLELARLQKDQLPQSAMDFEEMLQHSPNSSAIWIQFICFHLESAEVDKAKAVVRRALQVIDLREEEERLNVWTVLLRMEVLYGTPESVTEAYREAQITNDQLKVQKAMAMVYAECNKLQEAEKVYFTMTKKFSKVLDVWIKAGIFFYSNNMVEEAQRYMDRALLSIEKKDHVELIKRFAQLEYRFGEAERGRTMFEKILSNYPKRLDIWCVYVDLLRKRGDIEGARHILERMTGLELRLARMRLVFKRFLKFEQEHGTPQTVETVRNRVKEYVAAVQC